MLKVQDETALDDLDNRADEDAALVVDLDRLPSHARKAGLAAECERCHAVRAVGRGHRAGSVLFRNIAAPG